MLDWNCKHEFLNHITEQITTYICSKYELLSTSSEHDGAQLHPFGKDLFLATLVRILSDILSFFLSI
jgi:hypothetical protein